MSSSVISANTDGCAARLPLFLTSASKILVSSSDAFLTRRRTRPRDERVVEEHDQDHALRRRARCGCWSSRPRGTGRRIRSRASSLAMPPVAATLPAVSDDSDVTSRCSVSPAWAIGCPFLSMRRTAFAFASRWSRSQIAWICCSSSSYITSWGWPSHLRRDLSSCHGRPTGYQIQPSIPDIKLHSTSHLATAFERAGDGHAVGVLELATDGQA